jgi:hypothetical protein
MAQAIPQQHPAVVLRSHLRLVQSLLAVAMIAVVGLTIAVVVISDDGERTARTSSAASLTHSAPTQSSIGSTRYDGGPEEGTRGIAAAKAPSTRYDGGPEEGTRGITFEQAPAARYDGGPEEGSRGPGMHTD